MVATIESQTSTDSRRPMSRNAFIFLLVVNTINSIVSFGMLPSLSTYALLPFGQRAFYYWSVVIPSAYPVALVMSLRWKTASNHSILLQTIFTMLLASFITINAGQSPCPWLADTTRGAVQIIAVWFVMSCTSCFLRIVIGNRIKGEWMDEKGMFYYGATVQLGLLLGTVPTYLAINVFGLFFDRRPCQVYCLKYGYWINPCVKIDSQRKQRERHVG